MDDMARSYISDLLDLIFYDLSAMSTRPASCDDPGMGLLTEDPVPPGFTGTRLGVCNLCEAICGIELTLEDGAVTGIRGNEADPLSRGYICPKGVSMADVYADPDRLRRPIRRVGEGADATWEELGWDEALDLVADRLAATITEHGADAVGVYLGNPNAHSVGFATHGVPFVKSLRTRNRFSASTVDQIPHQFVAWQLFGHQLLLPVPDLDRTSFFLVLGANPMASNGSLMTVPDFPQRVRDLKARGGRMVVLDPRRTETAKVATEHHFVRPGSDAAVLLAMLHVLFEEGLTTPPPYVDHVDRVAELVADFTPELAEAASGVPGGDDPGADPRLRGGRRGRGVRPDGAVDPGLRLGVPVGDQPAQPAHRQLRPRGRRAVPRAGGRHRGPADRRARATTTCGAAGCGRSRSSPASCPPPRCARRSRRPATGRSGRW